MHRERFFRRDDDGPHGKPLFDACAVSGTALVGLGNPGSRRRSPASQRLLSNSERRQHRIASARAVLPYRGGLT